MNDLFIGDESLCILNPERRDLEPPRNVSVRGFVPFQVRGVDKAKRQVSAYVSTPNPDRYDEIILPSAFRKHLPTFRTNPVMLAGHSHGGQAGEPTIIGWWISLEIRKDGLYGVAQFLENDDLAEKWWQRFVQGAARAFSVGFIAHAWEMRDYTGADGQVRRLRTFTEVELIEISAVAVPANRESVVQALSMFAGQGAAVVDDDSGSAIEGISNRRLNKVIARSIRPILQRELAALLEGQNNNGNGGTAARQHSSPATSGLAFDEPPPEVGKAKGAAPLGDDYTDEELRRWLKTATLEQIEAKLAKDSGFETIEEYDRWMAENEEPLPTLEEMRATEGEMSLDELFEDEEDWSDEPALR